MNMNTTHFLNPVRHKTIHQIINECVSKRLRKYSNESVNINSPTQQNVGAAFFVTHWKN